MQRLAHRIYAPTAVPHVMSSTGVIQAATPSPVHLVFMHGLLGNHRNFASVCTAMSGAQSEESMKAELVGEMKRVTFPADCDETAGCRAHLAVAAAPRVYPCVAFDWRNHGDSAHTANMTLDGLAEDVTDFLVDYARAAVSASSPELSNSNSNSAAPSTPTSPVPLILVAHSMGALGVLHWMWTAHLRQWRDDILVNGHGALHQSRASATAATSPDAITSLFSNSDYRILGTVFIDTAPAERPVSFQKIKQLIRSLPNIPLDQLGSRAAVERWIQENGPKDLCTPDSIWLLRYQLSNLTFSKDSPPTWKVGLQEIIDGLDSISWHSGCDMCDAIVRDVERLAVSQNLPTPSPPPMHQFPVFYLFGATSPYDTPVTRAAVRRLFKSPCIMEMEDAGHFLFMQHKRTFVSTLQNVCYTLEEASGTL